MYKKSPIILFRNITNDHIQTKNRIKEFITNLNGICKNAYIIKILDNFSDPEEIDLMLTANPPVICILISNERKMVKLTNRINNLNPDQLKYVLFIDEVDSVDSTKANIRKPLINTLKYNSELTIGISATILGTYAEWGVNPDCIFELMVPENYIGLVDLKSHFYDTGRMQIKRDANIEGILATVPCLEDYIQKISLTTQINLISISTIIRINKLLFKYIKKKYPHIIVILMADNGFKVCNEDETHSFSNKMDVGSILGLLEKQAKCSIPIIILAGKKANRAVTFSSNFNKDINRWHVERGLFKLSDKITQDEAMQIGGRLCGIFEKGTNQEICANARDLETIIKSYHLQEDLLNNTTRSYNKVKLNDIKVSLWKLQVSGKTPTGRDKIFDRAITNRNSVTPEYVFDDGRHKEADFGFIVPTKGVNDNLVQKINDNNTRDEIIRILGLFPGLTSKEILAKSTAWNFIGAVDPLSALSQMTKTMSRENILARTGRPYKYTII